jgi:hypothetical protein
MEHGSLLMGFKHWTVEHGSTVPAGPIRFNAKNRLNQVRPNKIKKSFFIFNCVLFRKLVLNIIQWLHKLNGDRLMTLHLQKLIAISILFLILFYLMLLRY